jgi:hypothetical protein
MSFDVGVGRCIEITDLSVTVKLDSVMVHKWFPSEPWRRPGTSLLQFDRKLCSTERPPQLDQEIYVNADALRRKATGSLDLDGSGASCTLVDLRAILDGVNPMPSPPPKAKSSPRR